MRILHVVKTADGGDWAAREVAELVKKGISVHVAVPSGSPAASEKWENTGATLHRVNLDFPARAPWRIPSTIASARELVSKIKPDLIYSHFFGTTVLIRQALGKAHPIPRIFQVPGPLHLEHSIFREWDLASAGPSDFWIGSSDYIRRLYLGAGVDERRVFRSYYGIALPEKSQTRSHALHRMLELDPRQKLVGNVSFIYQPKYYLGETKGIKRHEDLIDALSKVTSMRPEVTGVLIGGPWKGAERYAERLRTRAKRLAGDRIRILGRMPAEKILGLWADFDLAVHVPASENCGGVAEPLLAGVPVIATNVGGLPEVIRDGETGNLVPPGDSTALCAVIMNVLDDLPRARAEAERGKARVRERFDVVKTASEIGGLYEVIMGSKPL